MIPILSGIIVGEGRNCTRTCAASACRWRTCSAWRHLCGGRRRRRAVRQHAVGGAAESLGAVGVCGGVRAARAVDVRLLRIAVALRDCNAGSPETSNRLHGGHFGGVFVHGRALRADRQSLRRRAAGRRTALHQPDPRRRAGRHRAVRDGARHGRAADSRRRVRGGAAAQGGPLDGFGEAFFRRRCCSRWRSDRVAACCRPPRRCSPGRRC